MGVWVQRQVFLPHICSVILARSYLSESLFPYLYKGIIVAPVIVSLASLLELLGDEMR